MVDVFWVIVSYCRKLPILTYSTCIWCLRWGWPRLSFGEIFSVRKRVPPCGVVCVILHLAVSVEHQLVTDRQTDTRVKTTAVIPSPWLKWYALTGAVSSKDWSPRPEGMRVHCAPSPPANCSGVWDGALEEVGFGVLLGFRNHQFCPQHIIHLSSLRLTVFAQIGFKLQQGSQPRAGGGEPPSHPSFWPLSQVTIFWRYPSQREVTRN